MPGREKYVQVYPKLKYESKGVLRNIKWQFLGILFHRTVQKQLNRGMNVAHRNHRQYERQR